jgi:hypothetical protein
VELEPMTDFEERRLILQRVYDLRHTGRFVNINHLDDLGLNRQALDRHLINLGASGHIRLKALRDHSGLVDAMIQLTDSGSNSIEQPELVPVPGLHLKGNLHMFGLRPQSDIDIVAPDGTKRHRAKGTVDAGLIIIPDHSLLIEPGDEIRRRIPSGAEETFEVIDPIYYESLHGIPAHYQVKVRRKGTFPHGQGGNYSVHLSGANARVNIASQDHSTNIAVQGDVFGEIVAALQRSVTDKEELDGLLNAVADMKREQGRSGFAAAYQKFVAITADHLSIITPFLPALTQFLPS